MKGFRKGVLPFKEVEIKISPTSCYRLWQPIRLKRARESKSDSSLVLKGECFNEPAAFSFQQDEILGRSPFVFYQD